jgi:hypothetical protein
MIPRGSASSPKLPIRYVDYIDQFGKRHRSGYGRLYYHWAEIKGPQPNDPGVPSRQAVEQRYMTRNNLVFMTQAGYNYDRERKEGEGNDWNES